MVFKSRWRSLHCHRTMDIQHLSFSWACHDLLNTLLLLLVAMWWGPKHQRKHANGPWVEMFLLLLSPRSRTVKLKSVFVVSLIEIWIIGIIYILHVLYMCTVVYTNETQWSLSVGVVYVGQLVRSNKATEDCWKWQVTRYWDTETQPYKFGNHCCKQIWTHLEKNEPKRLDNPIKIIKLTF